MFGLCIAERYYILGKCRIEWFSSEEVRNTFRAKLESSTTTWNLGEEVPKRKTIHYSLEF